jgi:Phytanoyl-CoA dioxygenase (PhyH)
MHRQRTHLAARITYVAKAVERRGIVATYRVHDRALANRHGRREHARNPVELDEGQWQIVAALETDGYAVLSLAELLEERELEAAVMAQGEGFMAETERELAREAEGAQAELRRRLGKEFVVRAYSFDGVALNPSSNAWFRACTSRRLLDLANSYLQMWTKLTYVDMWYTAPQASGAERAASQLWHRDFDDQHLLKAFLYLVDVDASAGPFEYVGGSQPGGPHMETMKWGPMQTGRVSEEDVQTHLPADAIKTFTAPRGTVILCNTSGLHRGGFATERPRALATATYCSAASLKALSTRNYTLAGDAPLDAAVRYATT